MENPAGLFLFQDLFYNEIMISFDDFNKLDIRIGTILEAEKVEGADKLLKLLVDIGKEKRTLVAGIAQDYQPGDIIGKQIPILANLEPKKLRNIESQGMILAVDIDNKATLLHPEKSVPNGSKVR
jgi:methionine--tRNA ligase beta chain